MTRLAVYGSFALKHAFVLTKGSLHKQKTYEKERNRETLKLKLKLKKLSWSSVEEISVTDKVPWMQCYNEDCPHLTNLHTLHTALDNPTPGTEICKLFKAQEAMKSFESSGGRLLWAIFLQKLQTIFPAFCRHV